MNRTITRTRVLLGAAALLALLTIPIAAAGGSGGPQATASAVSASKFKKLKKQVQELEQKVDQLQTQPGPQGNPGADGANGSARAYGRVSGQGVVDTARSTPGVTAVRLVEGEYCVTVPGLTQADAVIVPAMHFNDVDSLGGDTADQHQGLCPPNFGVETWNAAGTARDDASFNFVIP